MQRNGEKAKQNGGIGKKIGTMGINWDNKVQEWGKRKK